MYTYYLCASCGPKIQRIVARIKRNYYTDSKLLYFLHLNFSFDIN